MNKWAPWQQWAFGLLVSVLVAIGAGAYTQLAYRLDLVERRQVTVLERLASLDAEIVSLRLVDTQSLTQRERLEAKIDRLNEALVTLRRR